MITKKAKATEAFHSGMNCAQSVLLAYTKELKVDENTAFQISSGFGGGMGRLQKTCGAVTGAFMVIGLHNCNKYNNHDQQRDNNIRMIQEFNRKFISIHESIECIDIMSCDMNTEEGQNFIKENNLKTTICEKCVTDAIEIVNELIN